MKLWAFEAVAAAITSSMNLSINAIMVDFPDPLSPTRATVFRAGTFRSKPLRMMFSDLEGYVNSTDLNSTSSERFLINLELDRILKRVREHVHGPLLGHEGVDRPNGGDGLLGDDASLLVLISDLPRQVHEHPPVHDPKYDEKPPVHMGKATSASLHIIREKRRWFVTSPMTSWMMRLSLETLVMTSDMEVALRSKYSTSCLSIAFKYCVRIRIACLSPVLIQQNPSTIITSTNQFEDDCNQQIRDPLGPLASSEACVPFSTTTPFSITAMRSQL
ncbi:hypothetical protein C4D60_Mb03t12240 [Musa balbisiana]|uniref:Uncharacterized protein n=1 Tax=Musa balbisiana TaxID=52838 RepID=A0A4S8J9R2_MUSBA|nr:hypothetical protein C4D60_Mb03t12240 [Musa balbisiana]